MWLLTHISVLGSSSAVWRNRISLWMESKKKSIWVHFPSGGNGYHEETGQFLGFHNKSELKDVIFWNQNNLRILEFSTKSCSKLEKHFKVSLEEPCWKGLRGVWACSFCQQFPMLERFEPRSKLRNWKWNGCFMSWCLNSVDVFWDWEKQIIVLTL